MDDVGPRVFRLREPEVAEILRRRVDPANTGIVEARERSEVVHFGEIFERREVIRDGAQLVVRKVGRHGEDLVVDEKFADGGFVALAAGDFFVGGGGHDEFGDVFVALLFVRLEGDGARPFLAAQLQHLFRRVGNERDVREEKFVLVAADGSVGGHRRELRLQPRAVVFQCGDRLLHL